MPEKAGQDIVQRYSDNPLITLEDIPFRCNDIMNAAVVKYSGRYVMLITIQAVEGWCSLYLAQSGDGKHFEVERDPFMGPSVAGPLAKYEIHGISDPRITCIDEMYLITYVAESEYGRRIGLARCRNFETVERLGLISQPDTKNGILFPEKINGKFALLERPEPGSNIWLSYSSDLTFWGESKVVMSARDGYWDMHRLGASAPPIEIDEGWLLIYYGQKITSAGPLVRLGSAILDKDDPSKVIARSNVPILSPRERYERIGDVGNIVFSCAALLEDEGQLRIYYGASDSCVCLGTVSLEAIVKTTLGAGEEF